MKLESQCCTRSQAIRLHELGIAQDSLFYWWDFPMDAVTLFREDQIIKGTIYPCYSAYTVAELGAMLPAGIVQKDSTQPPYGVEINKCPVWQPGDKMWVIYLAGDVHYTKGDTEAHARAEMLIYLLEKGILTAEGCNSRLLKS